MPPFPQTRSGSQPRDSAIFASSERSRNFGISKTWRSSRHARQTSSNTAQRVHNYVRFFDRFTAGIKNSRYVTAATTAVSNVTEMVLPLAPLVVEAPAIAKHAKLAWPYLRSRVSRCAFVPTGATAGARWFDRHPHSKQHLQYRQPHAGGRRLGRHLVDGCRRRYFSWRTSTCSDHTHGFPPVMLWCESSNGTGNLSRSPLLWSFATKQQGRYHAEGGRKTTRHYDRHHHGRNSRGPSGTGAISLSQKSSREWNNHDGTIALDDCDTPSRRPGGLELP